MSPTFICVMVSYLWYYMHIVVYAAHLILIIFLTAFWYV